MTFLRGRHRRAHWMALHLGYLRSSHTPTASIFYFVLVFSMRFCWDLSGGGFLALNVWAAIIRIWYPLLFWRCVRGSTLHPCHRAHRAAFLWAVNASLFRVRGWMPLCLLIETSSRTRTVVAMCWTSVPRGCLLCICGFNVSLNILFSCWACLSRSRQRLAARQLASFLAMLGWASAGREHLLGGFSEWRLSGFLKLRRSWSNSSLLFPLNLSPCIFQMHSWNEHAQRTGKSLSSDREEMIVALHL